MTPTQTLHEIMKGCGYLAGRTWDKKAERVLEFNCGEVQVKPDGWREDKLWLCDNCQSRLTQFKSDLKMFKEMIESKLRIYIDDKRRGYSAFIQDAFNSELIRFLAPINEAIKQMGTIK